MTGHGIFWSLAARWAALKATQPSPNTTGTTADSSTTPTDNATKVGKQ